MSLRRPSRRALALSGTVLAMVLALVVADWVVRRTVEQRVAAAAESVVGTRPSVEIGGWSALVGLATDRWSSVRLTAEQASSTIEGQDVRLAMDLEGQGVEGLARGETITTRRAVGHATLGWQDLGRLAHIRLAPAGDGGVVATTDVTVMGERVPMRVVSRPTIAVDAQQLHLMEASATLDGVDVPPDVVKGMLPRVQSRVALPALPGMRFVTVQAETDGARLGVDGRDLSLRRP